MKAGATTGAAARPFVEVSYGERSTPFDCKGFHLEGEAIEFRSRWPFEVGTDLVMDFDTRCDGEGRALPGVPAQVHAEGVVVDCEMIPETSGCYKVTLLLCDLPPGERLKLNAISRVIALAAED